MDIKLLGQTFSIKVPKEKEAFYQAVATELDRALHSALDSAMLKNDLRIALQVAFKIACENAKLKEEVEVASSSSQPVLNEMPQIASRLDSCISKLKAFE